MSRTIAARAQLTPCLVHRALNQFEIELAFLWLNQIPINGQHHGIEVHLLTRIKGLCQYAKVRRRRIPQFAPEYQVWLSIHK